MDKYLGKKIDDRYDMKEIVGKGGMANVYKAIDLKTDKLVALKILRDEFLDNPEFLRRFRNESKAISVLSNPNIVKVIDVCFNENIYYIVMEYIDGFTLKEFIKNKKVLSVEETVHISLQILKALHHAHENGIVHRDIKPQNIMVLNDGNIKVTDFGIARFAREEARTMTEKALGTVHYISPEQAKGENTDEKTDIYSIGIIMFEMLTGTLPFEGDNAVSIAIMHMQESAKKVTSINPDIPIGMEEIIIRAMQKKQDWRYQSAAEMIRDLYTFLKNPKINFEYKYFDNDGDTRYFDTVNISNNSPNNTKTKEEKKSGVSLKSKKNKSKLIPILGGIASAFVIIMILILIGFSAVSSNKVNEVIMPDLVGKNIEDVVDNSDFISFKFEVVESDYTDEYDRNIIFDQNIRFGQNVKENTIIKLKVSLGRKLIEVPDLYNIHYTDAQNELKSLGFKFNVVKIFDPNIAIDRVIKTDPIKSDQLPKGSEIKIYVSMGPDIPYITVPNVVGKKEEDGKKQLDDLKLKTSIKYVDNDKEKGTIISQSIAGNQTVQEGTQIVLNVSSGKKPTNKQDFSVELPQNISGRFKFIVYVDGIAKYDEILNVATTSKFQFSLSDFGSKEVTVTISNVNNLNEEKNFVRYLVNFNQNNIDMVYKNDQVFKSSDSSNSSSSKPPTTSEDEN